MNGITEFFPSWTEALGWTLLNSLWQAMIITVLVVAALRIIPSRSSQIRYIIACAGMAFITVSSAATFIYLLGSETAETSAFLFQPVSHGPAIEKETALSVQEMLDYASTVLALNMPLIILGWCIGTILLSLRMISGWWYISKLRTESVVMDDAWNERFLTLARQLGINRVVTLAQSARIHAPMVVGFLKPIVLVPAGMLSGLSTVQVETIFIHELAHIRRHDYIINLVQSFIEALFFFNPFVWIISGIIRREREYCCDDTVITKHGSPLAYAHALARLEEVRLTRSALALSLAENKNQLLNRIKRIMEKSAKNYSGKDWLIPAVLLVVGLICASWLTITTDRPGHDTEILTTQHAADTVIKKNQKSASYSRKLVTTYDEKGEPREEVVEIYDGDEEMRKALMPMMAFDFAVPQVPVEAFPALSIPAISMFEMPVSPSGFHFRMDTIPVPQFEYRFEYNNDEDWKAFSEAFQKKFSEQFGDFYKANEKDIEKMMKELEKNFAGQFKNDTWGNEIARIDAEQQRAMAEMGRAYHEMLTEQAVEEVLEAEEHAQKVEEQWHENRAEDVARMEREVMEQAEHVKAMEEDIRKIETNLKAFEKEIQETLIKDGYLGKDEKLETINWTEDNGLEINGKSIKKADREKYNELRRKFFRKSSGHRIIE